MSSRHRRLIGQPRVAPATALAIEEYCPGCSDWQPASDVSLCERCGEYTCTDHASPRQHDCDELSQLRKLERRDRLAAEGQEAPAVTPAIRLVKELG